MKEIEDRALSASFKGSGSCLLYTSWMAEVKEELSKPQTPSLADLLIAYYNQRNAGAWSNKARTGNLKQFAEAVNYLTENKLLTLEDLQERLSSVNEEFEALSDSMKKKSARIKELQELIREGENYQRLKPVHTELNNIKFKKMCIRDRACN